MQMTGAQLFVKALQEEKVDTLFAYPGGQAIDLFDALYGAAGIQKKIMTVYRLSALLIMSRSLCLAKINNGYLGNVRQWQELFYQASESYGAKGIRVQNEDGAF